jgi:hypothetical protein
MLIVFLSSISEGWLLLMPIVFYSLFKFIFAGQVKNDGGFYLQKHT